MKCDWVRQNILFYVYNELEDDARYEVEQHLARCPECATELKATRKFHRPNTRIQDTANDVFLHFSRSSPIPTVRYIPQLAAIPLRRAS